MEFITSLQISTTVGFAFPEKYRENPNLKLDPTNVFLNPTTSKEDIGPTDDFDGNLSHEEAPAEKITKHKEDQKS